MHTERLKTLQENEEFIKKGGMSSDDEDGSWDDDDEDEMPDQIGDKDNKKGESSDDEEDEEWIKQQQIFSAISPKLQTGAPLTQEEMDLAKIDDDDDDDDSDYDYHSGEASLYDSNFDSCDEIKFLKDALI
jgi:hypothetical protein